MIQVCMSVIVCGELSKLGNRLIRVLPYLVEEAREADFIAAVDASSKMLMLPEIGPKFEVRTVEYDIRRIDPHNKEDQAQWLNLLLKSGLQQINYFRGQLKDEEERMCAAIRSAEVYHSEDLMEDWEFGGFKRMGELHLIAKKEHVNPNVGSKKAKAINYNGSVLVAAYMFNIGTPKYPIAKSPKEFISNVLKGIDSSYDGPPEILIPSFPEKGCTVMLFRLAQVALIASKQEGTK